MSLVPEPGSSSDAAIVTFLLKLLTAARAAAASPVISVPGSAVVGSAGTQLIDRISKDWGERGARNAVRVAELAAAEAGMDPDNFADRVVADKDARHVAAKVLPAAVDARTQQQLRLLSTILANVVTHPERVDEESLIATAVASLEPIHLRALATLGETPLQADEPTKAPLLFWSAGLLQTRLGWQMSAIISVLLTLQARGLIYLTDSRLDGGPQTYGDIADGPVDLTGSACQITAFGEEILGRARRAEQDRPEGPASN